ncbi:unnamed protein product [Caenorhabditis brenneri]
MGRRSSPIIRCFDWDGGRTDGHIHANRYISRIYITSLEFHEFGRSRLSWKTAIYVWEPFFRSMCRFVMVYAAGTTVFGLQIVGNVYVPSNNVLETNQHRLQFWTARLTRFAAQVSASQSIESIHCFEPDQEQNNPQIEGPPC